MKKITQSLLLAFLCALGITSCDNYEAPEIVSTPALTITSRETTFPSSASTGSITFTADGPVTVATNSDWLSATVSGNRIDISCTANPSLESRSGVITATQGQYKTDISVIQMGKKTFVIGLFTLTNWNVPSSTATTLTYELDDDIDVVFNTTDNWLTYSHTNGVLTITAARNTTGHMRSGSFSYNVDGNEGTVDVKQFDLDSDVVGTGYTFYYYTASSKATQRSMNAEIKKKSGSGYSIDFAYNNVNYSLPLEWDAETGQIVMTGGQYIGMNGENYVYLCFGGINPSSGGASYVHASRTDVMMVATPTYDESTGLTTLEFEDCGSYSSFPLCYIRLTQYNSNTSFSSSTQVGALLSMYYPYLER